MKPKIYELEPGLRVPENNIIERNFSWIFYLAKKITSKSRNKNVKVEEGVQKPERSLLQRRNRKEILDVLTGIRAPRLALLKEYKEQLKLLREEDFEVREILKTQYEQNRSELIKRENDSYNLTKVELKIEAKERDRIALEYLHQSELTINLEELGEQKSRFVVLNPPESKLDKNLPPIFLIPGISNDIDPVGALAQELAFSGRKVIIIAYPDSSLGEVSEGFADAMQKNPGFQYHADFFKKAIQLLVDNNEVDNFEIWSHSTGGPITAHMLEDELFRDKVENAVIISPASTVEQTRFDLIKGLAKEVRIAISKFEILSKYSLVPPSLIINKEKRAKSKNKDKVFSLLFQIIGEKYPNWDSVKVSNQGKVVFWSGDQDSITKTAENSELGSGENQIIINGKNGTHITSLVDPAKIIANIDKAMGRG